MRKGRKLVALLIIAAILLSFASVCLLSAYPNHTHADHASHCVLCAIASNADHLIRSVQALTTLFVLGLGLVCLGVLRARQKGPRPRRVMTPVTLKTKLSW